MNEDINLLRSLCWSFNHTTGIQFEDLFDAALEKYYDILPKYDSGISKRSTYIYTMVKYHLIWWCDRRLKQIIVDDIDIVARVGTPFYEFFIQIDKDVREVFEIILSSPEEFNSVTSRTAKSKLTYLLRKQNWTWKRIENVLKNAREYVSQTDEGGIIIK